MRANSSSLERKSPTCDGTITWQDIGYSWPPGSFSVWDISSVAVGSPPALLGQIVSAALYYAEGLWVVGNYAFVAVVNGTGGTTPAFLTVNISNPAAPAIIHTLTDTRLGSPENLLVVGNTAFVSNYLSTGTDDYVSIDISNPTSPAILQPKGAASLYEAVYSVNVGSVNYCTSRGGQSLAVIDASNPSAMNILGAINLGAWLTGVEHSVLPRGPEDFRFCRRYKRQ